MKILRKNESVALVARQKQEQIDEGVSIAIKIDTLREKHSSLQQQHEKFIESMKSDVEREIAPLKKERDDLIFDVASLKKQREKLLEPITEEVSKAVKATETARSTEQRLNLWESNLVDAEQDLNAAIAEANEDRKSIDLLKKDTEAKSKEVLKIKADHEKNIASVEAEANKRLDKISETEKELKSYETRLSLREVDLDNKAEQLELDKKELEDRTIMVRDRELTLEREFTRLNKNK